MSDPQIRSEPGRTGALAAMLLQALRLLAFGLPLAFLGLFYLYPLAAILGYSFAGSTSGLAALLADRYYLEVVWFSTWQAALSTALTLACGLPGAYLFARFAFPGKSLLRALATVPFVLPTVVVAAAWSALLGPQGLLNRALQGALGLDAPPLALGGTLAAVLLAHVFYNYGVVLRIVGGFWSTLDQRIEQAAAVLGARPTQVFRHVTLPLLLPAVGAAALLIFIFCFSSFGIVLILGGPRMATVEVEIYRQTAQLLRLDLAAALALVQMLATLLMTLLYTRLQARSSVAFEQRARVANTTRLRGGAWLLAVATIALIVGLLGAPLLALALRSLSDGTPGLTLDFYRQLAVNRTGSVFFVPPLLAVRNSLLFALLATVLALLLGVPAAYLLAGRSAPGRARPGRRVLALLLDPLFTLPLGTSAVTLGLGYVLALGRPPLVLLRSPLLIPLAHALLAFPFVVRSLLPALRSIDPRLREAARVAGAGPLRLLYEVDLPLLRPALLVGAVFAFTVSLGDFGAALLLARPEYPTVPVAIYRFLGQPGAANYGQALALSTLLMLMSGASFVLLERVRLPQGGEF